MGRPPGRRGRRHRPQHRGGGRLVTGRAAALLLDPGGAARLRDGARHHAGPRAIETTDFHGPVRVAVSALAEEGELACHRDAEFEAARLHALIDGLTIHVLARPDSMPPDRVSAVLAAHLEDLAT
ncbi:UNVERIFIED_ORG: hypothetical protein FHR35_003181 [Microbispora rosea subsp. rosea]